MIMMNPRRRITKLLACYLMRALFAGIIFTDLKFCNRILAEVMSKPLPEEAHFKAGLSNIFSMSSDNFKMFKEFLH
jgi:hypothetical protein